MAVNITAGFRRFVAVERFSLHVFGDGRAGEAQHGRGVIDKAHEAVGGGAGFAGRKVLPFFGETSHQRHVHAAVEQRAFVAGHAAAVVAVKKDNRVFGEAVVLKLLQNGADLLVHRGDAIVKARDLAPDERRVRIIRRQRHLGRVMNFAGRKFGLHFGFEFRVWPNHRAALMRGHQVENAEKRLRLVRPLAPVRGRAAIIPRMLDDVRVVAGVVIGLHVVARVKPVRPQPRRKPTHALGDRKAGAHLLRAEGGRITTGNQARPRRRTNRRAGKRLGVAHALLGQAIDVRRRCVLVAITAKRRAHILRRDPEDVRLLRSGSRRPNEQQK